MAAVFEVRRNFTTVLVTGRGTGDMDIHHRSERSLDEQDVREALDALLDQTK